MELKIEYKNYKILVGKILDKIETTKRNKKL
jgi:hypothetical protein